MYETTIRLTDEQLSRLPRPCGYKVLIAVPQVQDTTKGGIILPDNERDREHNATILGKVVACGDLAYHGDKFEDRSWCKEGDWVMFSSYTGHKFSMFEHDLLIVNDDVVEAVVPDPEGLVRR